MNCVELNPIGNFDSWETLKIEELNKSNLTDAVGQQLLFENDKIRLWYLRLQPYERIPFHYRASNYTYTSNTDGLAISRKGDGSIHLLKFKKGDTSYLEFENQHCIADLQNIGENELVISIMEHRLTSNNSISNLFVK